MNNMSFAAFGCYSKFEIYFLSPSEKSALIVLDDAKNDPLCLYIPSVMHFFTFYKVF